MACTQFKKKHYIHIISELYNPKTKYNKQTKKPKK